MIFTSESQHHIHTKDLYEQREERKHHTRCDRFVQRCKGNVPLKTYMR